MKYMIGEDEFSKIAGKLEELEGRVQRYENRIAILEAAMFGDSIEPLLAPPKEEVPTKKKVPVSKKKRTESVLKENTDLLSECSSSELVQILWTLGAHSASRQSFFS